LFPSFFLPLLARVSQRRVPLREPWSFYQTT